MIHPSAIIDASAKLADNVEVGPWSIIGPNVSIGEGSVIGPHVVIVRDTTLGKRNRIYQFSSIGEDTQDKKYDGEETYLVIGDDNVIRESVTLNRGTVQGGRYTRIGNENLFMASTHVAHDCTVGNNTIFSNFSGIAGHVHVDDYAILSGYAAVHQFCRIGAHSFIGGATPVVQDVLPYVIVAGHDAKARDINKVGLKRRGFSNDCINTLRQAFKIIMRQGLTVEQAVTELEPMLVTCPELGIMLDALKNSERGIVR